MESYHENEVKMRDLLRKSPGKCTVLVYIKDTKDVRELNTCSFDETQINLLKDAFGDENVKYQEKEIQMKQQIHRREAPKIVQIIPCNHDMYAVVKDSARGESKYKVLVYGLCDDGEVYPLFFDNWYGVCFSWDALFCVDRYELEGDEIVCLPEGGKQE